MEEIWIGLAIVALLIAGAYIVIKQLMLQFESTAKAVTETAVSPVRDAIGFTTGTAQYAQELAQQTSRAVESSVGSTVSFITSPLRATDQLLHTTTRAAQVFADPSVAGTSTGSLWQDILKGTYITDIEALKARAAAERTAATVGSAAEDALNIVTLPLQSTSALIGDITGGTFSLDYFLGSRS